jgi:hypothetical protein
VLAAYALPELKPNHPNHKSPAPSSSSVVLTLAMSVRQAAEGEEAVSLVGSVK